MGGLCLGLFILWHLLFSNYPKKTPVVLFIAFILAGIIAGTVLCPMYFTSIRFGFSRGYQEPFLYASNWANLIYKTWPDVPFNPIAKTPLWEYLRSHVKGETNIGVPLFLIFGGLAAVIARLKEPIVSQAQTKHPKRALAGAVIISILFAFLNMHSLVAKSLRWYGTAPKLATGMTYLYYIISGVIIYALRHRIKSAMKHLDFFLLLNTLLFGFLAFGPYYLTKNNLAIASPVAFLQYHDWGDR